MKISIIIPIYNESANIPVLYQELKAVLNKQTADFEIIFINDGSTDTSTQAINKLIAADDSIKLIDFTRNFGKETAVTAGLNCCQGQAAIIIDADLQHPVELIPQFIAKWQQDAKLVIGVRKKSYGINIFKRISSWFYYKIINSIAEIKVKPQATDYRLLDRDVINEFNRLTEKNRMVRGLIAWLGFKPEYLYFEAPPRRDGQARYNSLKLFKLALSSMISLSLFPLKFAGYLGMFITFIAGLGGLFIFIEKYILDDPLNMNFSGPAILAVIILFLIGIVLSCLGLIALYIANINAEVVNRPLYVIKQKTNFD